MRGHVKEEHAHILFRQCLRLNRGADGHHLVGVHALARLAAKEGGDCLLHRRHPGHAANENHLVDVGDRQVALFKRRLADLDGAGHEVGHDLVQRRPAQLLLQVEGLARLAREDEGKADLGLRQRGKLNLGLLRRILETLQRHVVLSQVDTVLLCKLDRQPLHDAGVKVLAAEEGVSTRRKDVKDAFADLQRGDIKGSAAKVVDRDPLVEILAIAVRQRRGGRLVDDPKDLETGNLARILGRLALVVVEVGRHGYDGLGHLLAQKLLRDETHLLQNHRGDFRDGVGLVAHSNAHILMRPLHNFVGRGLHGVDHRRRAPLAPNQPLGRVDGMTRIGDRLPPGELSDEPAAALADGHRAWRGLVASLVGENLGRPINYDRDTGVRGAEIDAYHFAHGVISYAISSVQKRGRDLVRSSAFRAIAWFGSNCSSSR